MNCRERLEKLPFKIRSLFTEIFEMFRCAVRVRRIPRIERAPESRDSLLFRLECLSFGTLQVWVLFMHDTRIQVLQDTRSTRVHIPVYKKCIFYKNVIAIRLHLTASPLCPAVHDSAGGGVAVPLFAASA